MINWPAIKSTVKGLIVDLLGVEAPQVRWQDEPEGSAWVRDPAIFLRISSVGEIGVDEERRTDQGVNEDDDMEINVCGPRRFTLSIRVESFTQKIEDPNFAGNIGSLIKTRLRRSSSVEREHGLFAVASWQPATWFNYLDPDGRQMSAYLVDLFCTTVDNDVDTSIGAGGFIEEVVVSGTVTDGSNQIPVNLDVVGE